MKKQNVLILVLLLVIMSMGGYLGYQQYERYRAITAAKKFATNYEQAHAVHHQGNFDLSISEFRNILPESPTKGAEAQVKMKLAFDLYSRNKGSDREEAVSLYKSVINDFSIPARSRAVALNDMAFLNELTADPDFMRTHVFNNGQYAELLKKEGSVGRAVEALYAMSDQIYPTALARIQMASIKATRLLRNRLGPDETQEIVAQKIQTLVAGGTPLIEPFNYEPSKKAQIYMRKGIALSVSNRVLHNLQVADIETPYKLALAAAESDKNDVHSQASGLIVRLYYAIMLLNHAGPNRVADIKELLKPFKDTANDPRFAFFQSNLSRTSSRPNDDVFKSSVVNLSKISPELKSYLLEIGWKV